MKRTSEGGVWGRARLGGGAAILLLLVAGACGGGGSSASDRAIGPDSGDSSGAGDVVEVANEAGPPDASDVVDAASDAVDTDGDVGDAREDEGGEEATAPAPMMTLELARDGDGTELPPVVVTVTIRDSDGAARDAATEAVSIVAENPAGAFEPMVTAVESAGPGRYRAVVSATRSGEIEVVASTEVGGVPLTARATIVMLPHVAAGWGVPRALTELNTVGHEDSVGISPDGRTIFFAYSPIRDCNYFPSAEGDPPEKAECREPYGPIDDDERPCQHGIGADGKVTVGLFGDEGKWPYAKSLFSSYAATRRDDGSFGPPVCMSFDDDGIVQEVGPTSGPVSPQPGVPYPLFFGYPDWLDVDTQRGGTIYAVAMIEPGASVALSDPITAISAPPDKVLAQSLTGDLNLVRESAYQIGEFRVFDNPATGRYELYFERQETAESTHDVVVSPLEGTFPVGDWGAAIPVPGAVNTGARHEGFPWAATLPDGPDGDGEGVFLFYNSSPLQLLDGAMQVMRSRWEGDAWGSPEVMLEVEPNGAAGGVLLTALPSVSSGDFGVEMFFVYVLIEEGGALDFQLGVVPWLDS